MTTPATDLPRAYLGVDIGTSSTKGVLVVDDGTVARSASRPHTVSRPAPGFVESDPATWWEELVSLAEELTGDGAYAVAAVGVSGMGPCVVLTEEDGTPVRPAILYGVDSRAGKQIAALEERLGRQEIRARTGSVLSSQAVGPKVAWVAEHEPEAYAKARRLFMVSSWLVHGLTGAYRMDRHSASQCTPMLDLHTGEWHRPWAEQITPGLELPELAWPGEVVGHTAAPLGGVAAGTPVVAGTIDAWAEAVSVAAQSPGDLMLMYGTTMFLIATADQPRTSEVMWGTIGAYPGTYNLAGGMASSGSVTAWVRDLTGGAPYEDLLTEAETSGVGARGLLLLPYFDGERTPISDPRARGVIAGLTLSHTRGDVYRAALEATAFGVRHNVEAFRDEGVQVRRVVAVGGGVQHPLWPQVVSDVTGLEQVIPTVTVGASYGMARLAATALGEAHVDDWNPPQRTTGPDPARQRRYDELYRHYRALYPATAETMHALADLTEDPTENKEPA
ncbi:FGGY-family carbohydrate kinase [Ornithinimicrobium sediminis]|uniref:FGGY-family carbohydrate kinase n=1 Tax=Ornithinimicrobium sediminis TaxID=2904603 RepID=UPI001E41F389|nr:FGGY family carbohydrate kinase [Ornithinimicrobium sediminis]MCE0487376.1 sugar kinase [Ornithinimicrobium sediminis]